ncbi:thioesterase II family protein [Micromonospora sp. CA-259024]|uniref:thioesterase II family protein n=1 Tax=Micromonospora sp. CA-259024 TaxID=3239965 RepID=UPI003D93DD7B
MTTATVRPDSWIRRYHQGPADRPRLVCFPHAGGSASFFFPVSRALSLVAEVCAVQYPGRQERRSEPAVPSVHRLADDIATVLAAAPQRPTVLFGHSMGAAVAFEVAHRLERVHDRPPTHLVVSGRRAPDRIRGPWLHRLPDADIVAELRRLSGTDDRLLEDPDVLRMILPALRSDYRAIETYRMSPGAVLRCPVTVLTGDSDPHVTADEAEGWLSYGTDPGRVRTFTGGHFFLLDHSDEVLNELRTALA